MAFDKVQQPIFTPQSDNIAEGTPLTGPEKHITITEESPRLTMTFNPPRIAAHELFSLFTATIIQEKVTFTR